MFTNLQNEAKIYLQAVIERLDGVEPILKNSVTIKISEVLDISNILSEDELTRLEELKQIKNKKKNQSAEFKALKAKREKFFTSLGFEKTLSYIYVISVSSESFNMQEIRDGFSVGKKRDKGKIAYARSNTKVNCDETKCLYVGSSLDFTKRYKEHLGYGAKTTYALQLKHWAENFKDIELTLDYAKYDCDADVLQALEDTLWDKKKPLFGRQGKK